MTFSQVSLIWSNKSAENISIYTWCTYLFLACAWFIHGLKVKDTILMLNNGLNIVVISMVVVGIILYQ